MKAILWLILETAASLVAGLCLLRAYAWWHRIAPLNNPLVNFSHAISQWLVKPIRQLIPPSGRMDWPSLTAAFLLALLTSLAFYLLLGLGVDLLRVPLLAVLWLINPHAPIAYPLSMLSEPLMRPFRRVIPLLGNFDLSPLAAILVIQIFLVLLDPTVVMSAIGASLRAP